MSPTEGSATKEMSLLTLNERDTTKRTTRPRKRDPVAIVQGYDTCLGKTDIKRMLFDHFSSCGQIKDIMFQRSSIGVASVYLYGEGAEDKVLDLDGSYMGGCKILVKLIPSSGIYTVHPRSRHLGWPSDPVVAVQGYDTSLSKSDIKKVLTTHFSSCGEVTEIRIHKKIGAAAVCVYGECAEEKVQDLDGSYIGEHKITVRLISAREIYSVHPRRRYRCPFPGHRTFGFSGLLARRECVSSRVLLLP
ncbi:hypothetical protein YC2023_124361 [Brassica napus]